MSGHLSWLFIVFVLSLLMLFGASGLSIYYMKVISRSPHLREFLLALMSACNALASLVFVFMQTDTGTILQQISVLFVDYRLYITLILEAVILMVVRKNFELNHNNITAITFAMFLSLLFVPIISFLLSDLFGFEQTINIAYANDSEILLFLVPMGFLVLMFFLGNKKRKIEHPFILFFAPLLMSFGAFFTVKLMQTYNSFLIFFCVGMVNFVLFSLFSVVKKERFVFNSGTIKPIVLVSIISTIFTPLNTIAATLVAVEFFIILKRIAQVVFGWIMDIIHHGLKVIALREALLVTMIFALGLTLYVLRG